jgi:hypothetical protein
MKAITRLTGSNPVTPRPAISEDRTAEKRPGDTSNDHPEHPAGKAAVDEGVRERTDDQAKKDPAKPFGMSSRM